MTKDTKDNKTIHLGMSDQYEAQVAQAWKNQKPAERKLTFKIPMDRLTPDMVIVPIVRGPERSPIRYEEFDRELGRPRTRERKPAELVGELIECEPVVVSRFWSGSGERVQQDEFAQALGGMLDKAAFVDALNRSTMHHSVFARTHHGDEDASVQLGWGS